MSGGLTTTLGWDSADRNTGLTVNGGTTAQNATVGYLRDASGRIIRRDETVNGTTTTQFYGFSGSDDSPDITMDGNKRVVATALSLPGGVLLTMRNNSGGVPAPTWDNPTVRGDLCMTTDQAGHQVGALRTYDPFGQPLDADGTVDAQSVPDNQPGAFDYGWLGQHQRPFEHAGALALVEMGARPYSPLLGRFLSVDPEPGGSANDYDYAGADPINVTDLTGECWICNMWHRATHWVSKHRGQIVHYAIGIGVGLAASFGAAAVCGATAGLGCLAIAGSLIGGLGSGIGNVAAARLMHERVSRRQVIRWTLAGMGSGAVKALRGGLELSGLRMSRIFRSRGLSGLRRHVHVSWTIFRTRHFW